MEGNQDKSSNSDNVVETKNAVDEKAEEEETAVGEKVDTIVGADVGEIKEISVVDVDRPSEIASTSGSPQKCSPLVAELSGKLEKVFCYIQANDETTKNRPEEVTKILETERLTKQMQDSSFESESNVANITTSTINGKEEEIFSSVSYSSSNIVELETDFDGETDNTTSPEQTAGSMWQEIIGGLCRCIRICNWFPRMCSCLETGTSLPNNCAGGRNSGSYEPLPTGPTLFEFSGMMQRVRRRAANNPNEVIDHEKQVELPFYNNDLTWTNVCVEKNLRTLDLCELLKVKTNAKGRAWSIVETWPELGIERTLEDHEDILAVHREMEMFASHHERKFFFREDFLKYELFIQPKQFFPPEMVAFPNDEDRGPFGNIEAVLRHYLGRNSSECPQVFSLVWIKDESSSTWKKIYMLLQGRKLYTTRKASFPSAKFMKSRLTTPKTSLSTKKGSGRNRSMSPVPTAEVPSTSNPSTTTPRSSGRFQHLDNEQLSLLARLSDYHIYKIKNAKKHFNATFEWGVCLRPSSNAEAEGTEAGVPGLKVIVFNSEKSRACWLTAMRLAKYGKQLRENYRAFKNKQCDQNTSGSPKDQYSSYNVPNESLRSRVAMDFTGSVGRIVDDPKEAKDIADNEGLVWRRTWRPFSRPPPGCPAVRLHGLDSGIHVVQPWFHKGLHRDLAAAIIRDHGSVNGVFLVRESRSNPGAYVLTYKYGEKVIHAQIQPVYDERKDCWLYTLDKGITKFYDLLQLIEFYQLNSGSLPTRLTHYVQNGVVVAQRRQESRGASLSPPKTGNRNSTSPKSDCPKTSPGI